MKHTTNKYIVEGEVSPGYESVKDLFISKFDLGSEENSQLCIYVKGEKVVDLWGRIDKTNDFNGDSLINVFSSTKSVTAIVMGMAYERGWFKYSDKIGQHWPEFATKGKEEITIADLMRHEAGMATTEYPVERIDCLPENIKKNVLGEKLAGMAPAWPKDRKREYHSITRGWLANEIFRRVHPENMTIGEFLEEEVSKKLGLDVYIGCEKENYFEFKHASGSYTAIHSLRKSFGMKSGVEASFFYMCSKIYAFAKIMRNAKPVIEKFDVMEFNTPDFRRSECPSANGNCSARGLAKLASFMANKGKDRDGTTLMNETAWEALHGESTEDYIILQHKVGMTQGGLGKFEKHADRAGYFGWMGYGGSAFQWHPELRIGFAYTCTLLFPISVFNAKAGEFQEEVAKCARNLETK